MGSFISSLAGSIADRDDPVELREVSHALALLANMTFFKARQIEAPGMTFNYNFEQSRDMLTDSLRKLHDRREK